ncbi:MAG: outer membrane protein assembly factor BamE [Hyphomicrobiaceae bacterium]|nr:outer membrane protein assembly factor BamE [Hyphomicrobiaceae bacterium]
MMSKSSYRQRLLACFGALALAAPLGACGEQIIKHGHQFRDNDIQQITPGMSQEQVKLQLGTPATTATIDNGQAFYYIASTMSQAAFLKEKEIDRKVLAVYFNPLGSVDRVAHYGMKDGKVFDYISRQTPAPGGKDDGILKQLFRNLGTRQLFGE